MRLGLVHQAILEAKRGCHRLAQDIGEDRFDLGMAGAASAAALTAFVTSATLRKDLPDRSHLVHGLPFLAWQAVREGVTEDRPSMTALALGAGYFLWQVPSLWLNSESWSLYPVLIAVFAAWWGWTGWRAMRR